MATVEPIPPHVTASLLGTAVGDAIGLPFEGMSGAHVRMLLGEKPLRHRLLFGRGLCSDDTEQTVMVLLSLIEADGDPHRFRMALARRLRIWFLLAPAGIGLATLKACLRLLMGFPPNKSGVMSAGNGAAMRSAIIGAWFHDDPVAIRIFSITSSRITHLDMRAIEGAIAVAMATAAVINGQDPVEAAKAELRTEEWRRPLRKEDRVTGYVVTTMRAVLEILEAHPDNYRAAIEDAVRRGGDTDTVAAIVGGILGPKVGIGGIPSEWITGLAEFPRSVAWMKRLGPYPWFLIPVRNVLFLLVVLAHGFRRLFPPYPPGSFMAGG